MAIDLRNCSEADLWRFIAAHLERRRIHVVLVGGAVVAIHSEGAYRSGDLDFVRLNVFDDVDVDGAMDDIGFRREGRHFVHPDCKHLFVEFVPGPLGIGHERRIVPDESREGSTTIRILSPTDCVCDRLASYIHFGARDCLDQAALVARAKPVDWNRIERWCRDEGPGGPQALSELKRLV
jgi:hypothetical protein